MADALTTITQFINSPPGVLAAGGVLAGIVWKFFERVEAVLTDDTKLEIAVWLVGVKTADHVPWPETFARVFDRVFGTKHLSWKCFWRSSIASFAVSVIASALGHQLSANDLVGGLLWTLFVITLINVFPDYVSMGITRWILGRMRRKALDNLSVVMYILIDFTKTVYICIIAAIVFFAIVAPPLSEPDFLGFNKSLGQVESMLYNPFKAFMWAKNQHVYNFVYPAFFTSIWLWLYAGSGFLLKAANRFDIGFQWFNRKFDIEKKPLQSIGLVAGALVAVVYWSALVVSRVVK